jgi:hypothetical protein
MPDRSSSRRRHDQQQTVPPSPSRPLFVGEKPALIALNESSFIFFLTCFMLIDYSLAIGFSHP